MRVRGPIDAHGCSRQSTARRACTIAAARRRLSLPAAPQSASRSWDLVAEKHEGRRSPSPLPSLQGRRHRHSVTRRGPLTSASQSPLFAFRTPGAARGLRARGLGLDTCTYTFCAHAVRAKLPARARRGFARGAGPPRLSPLASAHSPLVRWCGLIQCRACSSSLGGLHPLPPGDANAREAAPRPALPCPAPRGDGPRESRRASERAYVRGLLLWLARAVRLVCSVNVSSEREHSSGAAVGTYCRSGRPCMHLHACLASSTRLLEGLGTHDRPTDRGALSELVGGCFGRFGRIGRFGVFLRRLGRLGRLI